MPTLVRSLAFVALVALPVVAAAHAQPTVLHVDASAAGANDGSSWPDAFIALQDAFDVANLNPGTDYTIRIATGLYAPDVDQVDSDGTGGPEHTPGDRSESFTLSRDGVTVEGGYPAGGGPREPAANPTVLSGDLAGDDVTNADGVTETADDQVGLDNAFRVVVLEGGSITAATRLDGIILTAGSATGGLWESFGGGLYCDALGAGNVCSPTLLDVTFAGGSSNQGTGGMYVNARDGGEGSPALTGVTFSGHFLGALAFSALNGGTALPTLNDVTVQNNTNGALRLDGRSGGLASASFSNVHFIDNTGQNNGGAVALFTASATFTGATFTGNQADNLGGAVYATSFDPVDLVFERSTFAGNTAVGTLSGSGGAIYHDRAVLLILDRVTVAGNEALDGGAVYSTDAEMRITNTVFSGNRAIGTQNPRGLGGALRIRSASASSNPAIRLTNVTLAHNEANAEGGAIYVDAFFSGSLDLRLANSILYGNRANADGVGGGDGDQIFNTFEADTEVRYSLVEGSSVDEDGDGDSWNDLLGVDGGGNRDADPQFADPNGPDGLTGTLDDDLRLRGPGGGSSPGIDAGDNAALPADRTEDRAGLPRYADVPEIDDTGVGTPPLVDLGAYESDGRPLPVELVRFSAQTARSRVLLRWETAFERENAGFHVLKEAVSDGHADGSWNRIGFVAGGGTTDRPQSYSFRTDPLPPGLHGFRLEQIDYDGTSTLSPITTVRVAAESSWTLFPITPNPARHTVRVRFTTQTRGAVRLELVDVLGRVVRTVSSGSASGGIRELSVPIHDLAAGLYFVRLPSPEGARVRPVSVVR